MNGIAESVEELYNNTLSYDGILSCMVSQKFRH